jgi:hypothetical protein
MTIRVRDQLTDLDARRIAAAITNAVLHPVDETARTSNEKAGTAWLRWSDTVAPPAPPKPHLD